MIILKLLLPLCILLSCSPKNNIQKEDKPELIGTEWRLIRIGNADLVTAGMGQLPYLKIKEDKKVEGYSGCNQFHSVAAIIGKGITFSKIASTRRYCPHSDKETEMFSHLESATSYSISQNLLIIHTQRGTSLTFIAHNP